MKRLVNARLFLFAAVGLVLGILCGYSIMFGKWIWPIICVLLLATTLTILLIRKNKLYVILLFVFIFTILGTALFQAKIHHEQKQEVVARTVNLTGRVTDIGSMGQSSNLLYLENCTYDNVKIPGRVQVTLFDVSDIATGDILTLSGTLRSTYLFAENFNSNHLRNNCKYQLTDVTLLSQKSGKLTLAENIRKYIFERCQHNMFKHSGLMYALITGDTGAMDAQVKLDYKNAGMIHLVAVSGMHLVYVITIVGFFINKLKLNPLAEFAVMIGPLVFFCYICGWAPSILRALLMTVCTYVVRWLSGRYDMLIALSWSVLVLLFVNPYYLFDIGWQLSVMSVFGMATIHLRIDRFLTSKKMPKFVYAFLSSLSISLSCTLSTFATVAYYFGEVPILGVLSNLIGVPLMSWAFTAGLVGLLPWVFKYALHVADGILYVVSKVAQIVASWDVSVVSLSAVAVAIAVTIVWLFVVGQYLNLKKIAKIVVNCALCVVLVVCFVVADVKTDCTEQVFVHQSFDGASVVVTNDDGDVVVISNCSSAYIFNTIKDYICKYNYKSVTWVFSDVSQFALDIDEKEFADFGLSKVYNLTHFGNDRLTQALQSKGIPLHSVANNLTVGDGITVQSVYDGSLVGVVVKTQNITFAIVDGGEAQTNHFLDILPSADFYVVKTPTNNYLHPNLVTFSLYQDYCDTNYGANKYGNFTITQKDGTIVVNF